MTSFFSRRDNDEKDTAPADPDSEMPLPMGEAPSGVEADLREQMLRVLAELDNLRRRTARDADLARKREREEILRAFVTVLDSFDSALGAEGAEGNRWVEGFHAIREQMVAVFAGFGVRPVESLGEVFDPHQHDAVAVAHVATRPEGEIVEVIQSGYAFADGTVLRPAKVIVNGGGPGA